MKLQKGIIQDKDGTNLITICEVSNPDKPEVLMAFFNSWNSAMIAENIMNLIVEKDKELSKNEV